MGDACIAEASFRLTRALLKSHGAIASVLAGFMLLPGCRATPRAAMPLEALPLREAAAIVNANISRIDGTIRASGTVDGHFRKPGGGRMSYSLDGTLFHLAPGYVRFDLKKLGERQLLLGSNGEWYWFFSKEEGGFRCWRHGDEDAFPEEIPIRPDRIVEALGLTPIVAEGGDGRAEAVVQRVEGAVQQVLFVERGPSGEAFLTREYWLDRFAPRLVRRVVFRDGDGAVTMESFLDDYRSVGSGGPMLPHRMSAEWPGQGAFMRFSVGRWTIERGVSAEGPQFATPRECGEAARRVP